MIYIQSRDPKIFIREIKMKNINWINLIQNIVRCIIAYPLFLIALVISIPLSIVGWFVCSVIELVLVFVHFILTGDFSLFKDSSIRVLITDHSFYDLMIVLLPITMLLIKKINVFNKTLKPIRRS